MSTLKSSLIFAYFLAVLPVGCRSGDNPPVKPEPAPETTSAKVEPAPSASVVSPGFAAPEPAPSASAVFAETESSASAPKNVPPKTPPPIPLPRTRPLGEKEIVAVLVRSNPKGNAKAEESTQMIQADGKFTTKKGLWMFVNGQLHRYQQRENVSPNPPCPGETENMFPKRIWRNAELIHEKSGKSTEIIPAFKPKPNSEEIIHTETEQELVAAVPGFVFIKSSETDYGCGAHPLYGSSFVLAAIGANGSIEKVESTEYLVGTEGWTDHAMVKFNAQVDPAEAPDSLDGRIQNVDDVKIAMVYPMMTAKGAVWTGLFTAPATWAGSYGSWAGYTRALPMPINKVPARFRDALVTPEPVNDYVTKHEKDESILGFTVGQAESK